MLTPNETDNFEIPEEFVLDQKFVTCMTLILIFLLQIVIFPFYVYVIRLNRKKDQMTAIYPIIVFFYRITCFTVVGTVLSTALWILSAKKLIDMREAGDSCFLMVPVAMLLGVLPIFITLTYLNMTVCQLMTSILAFHRCLLYFVPRTKELVNLNDHSMSIFTGSLYFGTVIMGALLYTKKGESIGEFFLSNYYHYLSYTSIIIAVPYTMMFLSIRKLTYLTSKLHSKPEKYIAYQVIIVLITKVIILTSERILIDDAENPIFVWVLVDLFTFILPIELAYLLSNKSNVDSLLQIFTRKIVFWRHRYQVENGSVVMSTTASNNS